MKKPKNRLNAVLYATLIQELMDGPSTRVELMTATGLSHQTILSNVRALHERGLIHVACWEKDAMGRHSIAAFTFGRGGDARKPAPLTPVELKRAQRRRQSSMGTPFAGLGG
jgi:hypothetical protein